MPSILSQAEASLISPAAGGASISLILSPDFASPLAGRGTTDVARPLDQSRSQPRARARPGDPGRGARVGARGRGRPRRRSCGRAGDRARRTDCARRASPRRAHRGEPREGPEAAAQVRSRAQLLRLGRGRPAPGRRGPRPDRNRGCGGGGGPRRARRGRRGPSGVPRWRPGCQDPQLSTPRRTPAGCLVVGAEPLAGRVGMLGAADLRHAGLRHTSPRCSQRSSERQSCSLPRAWLWRLMCDGRREGVLAGYDLRWTDHGIVLSICDLRARSGLV